MDKYTKNIWISKKSTNNIFSNTKIYIFYSPKFNSWCWMSYPQTKDELGDAKFMKEIILSQED